MNSQRDRDARREQNVRRARGYIYGGGESRSRQIVLAVLVALAIGLLFFGSNWNEWTTPGVSERTRAPTMAPPASNVAPPSTPKQ